MQPKTETTAEQKELWFLGDDKHWTQYNLAELKKYVFQLKGKIEDLEEEVRMLNLKPRVMTKVVTKVITQLSDNEARVLEINNILRKQVEAYEAKNKTAKRTAEQDKQDKEFIAELLSVPTTWLVNLRGIRESPIRVNCQAALVYLLDKRGLSRVKISESIGLAGHTTLQTRFDRIGELTLEQKEAIDNYYNRTK